MGKFSTTAFVVCTTLLVVWIGGCDSPDYYGIAVINKTGSEVDHVAVSQAGPMGVIVKDGTKAVSSFSGRPPETFVVSWTDSGGDHRVEVDMKGVVPPHFRGTIYLKLRRKEEVNPSAILEKDIDGAVRVRETP